MRTKSPWLALLTIIVVLFMLSPMLLSILAALVNQYSKGLESGLTLRWLSQVFDQYGSTVVASLLIAATCAVANAVIGVPCAYALARAKGRWAKTFEELLKLQMLEQSLQVQKLEQLSKLHKRKKQKLHLKQHMQ